MINHLLEQSKNLYTEEQQKQLVPLFFVMLLGALLEAVGVSAIVPFVAFITQEDFASQALLVGRLYAYSGVSSNSQFALFCIAGLVVFYLLKAIYLAFEVRIQARFIGQCKKETQKKAIRTLLEKPYPFYLSKNTAEIQKLLVVDINKVFQVQHQILGLLTELCVFMCVTAALFLIDPGMSLCVLAILSLTVVWISFSIRPKLHNAGNVVMANEKLRSRWIAQGLEGIKEVKHMQAEEFIAQQADHAEEKIYQGEQTQRILNNVPRILIETVCICGMLVILAVMVLLGKELSALLPAVSAFAMAAVKLLPGANKITAAVAATIYNMPALDHVVELLNKHDSSEIRLPAGYAGNPSDSSLPYDIVFTNVTYTYPDAEESVLKDVSLSIKHGEMVGIIGPSGTGKTTFADLLMGLLPPDAGTIAVYGKIGYIPQALFMLDDTVRANVAFGVPLADVSDEKIWYCLEEAQLADHFRNLACGLDTGIGERGVRLSGGQIQRIAIARALYRDPDILVFDEATSALDLETETAIMDAVKEMHGKRTIVIIAHKSGVLADCDVVYRVSDGKIKELDREKLDGDQNAR